MSVATGAAKLQAKVGLMQQKYQASMAHATANWVAGLSAAGAPPGPMRQAAYAAGIQAGASSYGPAVQAGVAKWQSNFVRAMSI